MSKDIFSTCRDISVWCSTAGTCADDSTKPMSASLPASPRAPSQPTSRGTPKESASAASAVLGTVTLIRQGSRFLFPDSYCWQLVGRLSREEFSGIVAELNATVRRHTAAYKASVVGTVLGVLPIVRQIAWRRRFTKLRKQLQRTCGAINERYEAAGLGKVHVAFHEVLYGGVHERYSSVPTVEIDVEAGV